ncbi:MAG: sigma-70 family RNA polymerase sigma factor [Calditrichaeota bacterium]|jgi:RNA polymerase sigma factor FliA|nr:sigma-70 family RNA polymerase sigma factor [Calditrichota bacterium]MBT7789231.1 sigma-70 family RNA polymerase sigma factor [Calditrichota bacterium]
MCASALAQRADGEILVLEFIKDRSQSNKDQAVRSFLPLVKHIANRIYLPENAALKKEDLLQFGIIGLLDALERYTSNYGAKFKTYAYKRIYGEIVDAIRREGILSKDQLNIINRISKATDTLRSLYGREPTTSEICEEVQISEEKFSDVYQSNTMNYMLSLDDKIGVDANDRLTRKDTIVDEGQVPLDAALEKDELKAKLKEVIKILPERKRIILALYYYEDLTLLDIGQVLCISESRVSQILNQTLMEIRNDLGIYV